MSVIIALSVSTAASMPHVLGLGRAARKRNCRVEIFLTGDGVDLIRDPAFAELTEIGRVSVCEVSFLDRGYAGRDVCGLEDRDFVTQGRNAELVAEADRYLAL